MRFSKKKTLLLYLALLFQACQQLQEYELAIEAFSEVLKLEPDNREAQMQLKQSRNMRKAHVDKEKKLYANMFKKLVSEDKKR